MKLGLQNSINRQPRIPILGGGGGPLLNDFSQYTTGVDISTLDDWSQIDSGGNLTIEERADATGGKVAVNNSTSSGKFLWLTPSELTDVIVTIRFRMFVEASGDRAGCMARYSNQSSDNGYQMYYDYYRDREIYKFLNNTASLLLSKSAFDPVSPLGEWSYIKFRVLGVNLDHKIWAEPDPEPEAYYSDFDIDDSDIAGPGFIGLRVENSDPLQPTEIDWISVEPL